MESANTFIPTAGQVGLLPMFTYFSLLVAAFGFLGLFLFGLLASRSQPLANPKRWLMPVLIAVAAAVSGLTYVIIQSHYYTMLSELAPVTDPTDRQTLIRESYNAIGQYRYVAWFVTTPVLLFLLVLMLRVRLLKSVRPLLALLGAGAFLALAGYIGHQQLSFDNEIIVRAKLIVGLFLVLVYVLVWVSLHRFEKVFFELPWMYRLAKRITLSCLGVYVLGYFLTLTSINFNWLHIACTLADVVNQLGVAVLAYINWTGIDEEVGPATLV